jgi:hypothetical protein
MYDKFVLCRLAGTPTLVVVENNVAWILFDLKLDEVGKQLFIAQGGIS